MNPEFVNLDDELYYQIQHLLLEIRSELRDLLQWTERFPKGRSNVSTKRELIAIKRISSTASELVDVLDEFLKELHPVILTITLSQMIFDIHSPISVIHAYVEMFKIPGFEMITAEEIEATYNISRCEQILLELAKKLEYYNELVEQQERMRSTT